MDGVSRTDEQKRPRVRISRAILMGGVALIGALLAGMGAAIWQARIADLAAWRQHLSNHSLMLSEHALQSVRAADLVLKNIIDRVQDLGIEDESDFRQAMGSRDVFDMLKDASSSVPQIDVATIVALNGDMINFSRSYPAPPINLADRDYIQAHAANPELAVFMSVPVPNRATGRWTFYLARKIRAKSGRIVGLALTGIESSFFQDFYAATSIGPDSAVSLFRNDGALLARYPARDDLLGASFANATAFRQVLANANAGAVVTTRPRHADPQDQRLRIVAARLVKDYPLAVNVTATEELVLAGWRRWAVSTAVGTAVVLLVLAGLMALIVRLLARQERVDAQRDRHYRNLHALAEITALPSGAGADKLGFALRLGAQHLGLELAIISQVQDRRYTVVHCCAPAGHDLKNGAEFALGDTYCSITLQARDVVAIPNMEQSPHAGHPCYRAFGLECYIGVPIDVGGQVFGTVNFSSARPYRRTFDDGDREFMRLLGHWVGSILDEQRMTQELNRLATSDPLTGVWNRREFMRLANRAFGLATRHRRPLSLLMLDVDRFKRINDRYGHAAGDAVLVGIAGACTETLREQDVFGRYGGEEFVVMLPETDLTGAGEAAERLRQKVAALALASGDDPIRVTVSIGVASLQDGDPSVEHLLDRADSALYQAKANGRNRIERAERHPVLS